MSEWNSSSEPSGDHLGDVTLPRASKSFRSLPPTTGAPQRCPSRRYSTSSLFGEKSGELPSPIRVVLPERTSTTQTSCFAPATSLVGLATSPFWFLLPPRTNAIEFPL